MPALAKTRSTWSAACCSSSPLRLAGGPARGRCPSRRRSPPPACRRTSPCPRSSPAVPLLVNDPRCLQLHDSPGRVVHLPNGQVDPVEGVPDAPPAAGRAGRLCRRGLCSRAGEWCRQCLALSAGDWPVPRPSAVGSPARPGLRQGSLRHPCRLPWPGWNHPLYRAASGCPAAQAAQRRGPGYTRPALRARHNTADAARIRSRVRARPVHRQQSDSPD